MSSVQGGAVIRNLQFTRQVSYVISSSDGPSGSCNLEWGEIWLKFELFVDGHSAGWADTTPLQKREGYSNWDTRIESGVEWLIPRFDDKFQQLLLQYDDAPGTANSLLIQGFYKINQYQVCAPWSDPPEGWTPGPGGLSSQPINPPQTFNFSPSVNIAELIKTSEQDPEKHANGYTAMLAGETIVPPGFKQGFTPTLDILIRVPIIS